MLAASFFETHVLKYCRPTLDVSSSSISNLTGIEDFTSLNELRCQNNQLSSLDVNNNIILNAFNCSNNQLTSLDVTQNTALTYLNCNSNQLTTLNVANGNNSIITQFKANGNPNLSCIQVDDVAYSTTN